MKNFTWSWNEPDEDIKPEELDYPESLEEDIKQEQDFLKIKELI